MKLTLQILDAGETFFQPLEARPFVVGSDADADLRLTEAGVAPHHARIEPDPEGGHRLVDLGSEIGTRINGRDVAQCRLALGDRIEIGASVLVIGQSVARKATVDDVLADGAALSRGQAELRSRRIQREAPARRHGTMLAVAVVALAAIGTMIGLSGRSDQMPLGWGDLERMRRTGDVAAAREMIGRFEVEWAKDDAARRARLAAIESDLAAIENGVAAGAAILREEAATKSSAQQLDELRARRGSDDDGVDAIVARILSTRLRDIRDGVEMLFPVVEGGDPVAVDPLDGPGPAVARADVAGPGGTDPDPAPAPDPSANASNQDSVDATLVDEQIASIDRLRAEGRFSEGYELCSFMIASADQAHVTRIRDAESRLRADAEADLQRVLRQVDNLAGAKPDVDKPSSSVDAALLALHVESLRFPAEGTFAVLRDRRRALESLRTEIIRHGEAVRGGPSLVAIRDQLAAARAEERDGNYAAAGEIVAAVAESVRASDPAYASALGGRANDLGHLARLLGWLCDEVRSGRALDLSGVEAGGLKLAVSEGRLVCDDGPFEFGVVTPDSLARLVRARKADSEVLIGVAVAAYRAGERELAETVLGEAFARQKDLQPALDGVIARGRGETVDAAGYRWVDGEFVAAREIEARARAKELRTVVARVARLPTDRREKELATLLEKGPRELDALVIALRSAAVESATRIERDTFRRHFDAVATLRRRLDEARAFAKELIFDEQRYFYPYKAPAVSAERASEYWKVQGEVDERVARVRELWDGKSPGRRVPKKLLDELGALEWMSQTLAGFAERVPDLEDRIAWLRAVPVDRPLDLRSFAWDEGESKRLDDDRRIHAFNQKLASDLTSAEREILRLTNDYRTMFGHRALAMNRKLIVAARGHAAEMGHMGYFSHFSPIPEHRSPFDRMKQAGYGAGVSENIANYPSAPAAHDGWLHSSGHHRNLLQPSHTEFAIGNAGRLWVENFGRGDEYLEDAAYR